MLFNICAASSTVLLAEFRCIVPVYSDWMWLSGPGIRGSFHIRRHLFCKLVSVSGAPPLRPLEVQLKATCLRDALYKRGEPKLLRSAD